MAFRLSLSHSSGSLPQETNQVSANEIHPWLVASNLAARSRPQLFTFRDLWAWLNVRMEGPRGALSVGSCRWPSRRNAYLGRKRSWPRVSVIQTVHG
jgi:hypothetical protein